MVERTVRIGSAHGLHARPAKLFAQAAKDAGIPITIQKAGGAPVNAASILGVIALGIEQGDYVTHHRRRRRRRRPCSTSSRELLTTDHDVARGIRRPCNRTGRASDGDQGHGHRAGCRRRGRSPGWPSRCRRPVDAPSHARPRATRGERAKASLSVVAARARAARGAGGRRGAGRARGAGHDGRGPEPRSTRSRQLARAPARPPSAPCTTRSPSFRDLLTAHGRLPRRARRRPRRRRAARHRAAARAARAGRARTRGIRSCSSPRTSRRPTPPCSTSTRCSALVTTEGGPTSHTAILAREKSIVAVVGAADAASLADGETVIVDRRGRRRHRPTRRPTQLARGRGAHRRARRASRRRPITAGRARRRHAGAAAREPRQGRRRGRGGRSSAPRAWACSAPSSSSSTPTQAPSVASSSEHYTQLLTAFPGKKVVVRVLDAGADKPLAVPQRRARGEPGARAPRHPRPRASEDHPARAAHRARRSGCRDRRRPLGHGADGRDGRGDRATSPTLAKELRHPDRRGHGRGAVVGAAGRPHPRRLRTSRRSARTTSPSTRWPPTACSASVATLQDPWHPAVLRLIARGRRRRARDSASPSASAARPRPTRCSPSCSWASAPRACRCHPSALADVRASLAAVQPSTTRRRIARGSPGR